MLSYAELKVLNEKNKNSDNKNKPWFQVIRIVDLDGVGLVELVNGKYFRAIDTLYYTITQGQGYVTNLSRIKGVYNKLIKQYRTPTDAFVAATHQGYTPAEYFQDMLDTLDVNKVKYN